MFSAFLIGLLVAASASTWAYTKAMRRTGNLTEKALVVAGLAGFVSFIVVVTLVWTIDSLLGN